MKSKRAVAVTFNGILFGFADSDGNWRIPTRRTQKWFEEKLGIDPRQLRAVARENLGKPFKGIPVRWVDDVKAEDRQ